MFVISLATTSGLSFASAGSSISNVSDLLETDASIDETANLSSATPGNWTRRRLNIVAVAFSLIGVAAGWAMLAAGAAGFNIHGELRGGGPKISDGPDLGENGISLASRLIVYLIIGIFVVVLIGGYFYRLRPRFHASQYRRSLSLFGDGRI